MNVPNSENIFYVALPQISRNLIAVGRKSLQENCFQNYGEQKKNRTGGAEDPRLVIKT